MWWVLHHCFHSDAYSLEMYATSLAFCLMDGVCCPGPLVAYSLAMAALLTPKAFPCFSTCLLTNTRPMVDVSYTNALLATLFAQPSVGRI